MALVADRIEYNHQPLWAEKDSIKYYEPCPEDWWKRGENIEYNCHSFSQADEVQSDLEKEFNKLATTWKAQTKGASSLTGMVMSPAYLEIISYGEKMIPFILKDLKNSPSHWFIALRILARTSPVRPEDAGNIKKMSEAWISWGRENGMLT
jgi:hypothetical protein